MRSPRNRMDVEGHAKQASGRSITDAVAGRELVPQDSLGEKVVPVPKSQPKAEAAAKTEGTARKAGASDRKPDAGPGYRSGVRLLFQGGERAGAGASPGNRRQVEWMTSFFSSTVQ